MKADKGHATELRSSQGNLPSHTPGPWRIGGGGNSGLYDTGGQSWTAITDMSGALTIANVRGKFPAFETGEQLLSRIDDINARRIVACVNYCEGVSTEEIEAAPAGLELRALLDAMDKDLPSFADRYDSLKAHNAELTEALRSITSGIADHLKAGTVRCDSCTSEVENARAVLAKVAAKP